ncbi:NAD kinase [Halanaeroarchaeum sp. HSR-CO]|uniref:ATP-NAD kinase n=1 Tax=Halanaeroarchaeum sp. HSR-CO TaxID=2866382 RepID=UPI00217E095F|nr:ATP-NAD kinase [Halanaeroarchaeum sp. HSR-CO]UWG47498.1 NAD kinase [Halanaeroarchaeum sp. HSR-CO]
MNSERRTDPQSEIGVVGDDAAAIVDSVREAGGLGSVVETPTATVDVMVVAGESALLSFVRADVDVPVLPVEVGSGVEDVAAADLDEAIRSLVTGTLQTTERPLLVVTVEDDSYAALMDVMVVTEEPAKISEFAIGNRFRGGTQTVDQVRADGVVVATSVGTPGYVTAAGGPVLGPETSGVAVVPIGPFRIEQSQWVLEPPISLTVARDDTGVSLLIDDEEVGPVPAHEPIELAWGKPLDIVRTPVSRTTFDREN